MDEVQSPAAEIASEAPEASITAAPTAPSDQPASVEGVAPEAPKAPEPPDHKALVEELLQSPEGRKYLLDHPELRKEIDHRANSEAGRRAKVQAEQWERQRAEQIAAQQQQQFMDELTQLVEQENYDSPLAQRLKPILEQNKVAKTQTELLNKAYQEVGNQWFAMLDGQVDADPDFGDEDKAKLRSRAFNSLGDFLAARDRIKRERIIATEVPKLAKKEAEALLEERGAGERAKQATPAVLPPTNGAANNDDFVREYAAGRTNDTARAAKLLKELGLAI